MRNNLWLLTADEQFYVPLRPAPDDPGRLVPSDVPDGWAPVDSGVWCRWGRSGLLVPEQGWKVHVSATPDRLGPVLDAVARACFDAGVPFKHLATRSAYLMAHQKHSPRVQAGKFCAAYPGDVERARRLMERLERDLAGEVGVFVLTDRRYGDSNVVHYRYGAFARRERLCLDGTREPVVRDGDGRDVPDERRPWFSLPPGVEDPFAPPAAGEARPGGPVVLADRFEIKEVIRHSNGGGTYRARDIRTGGTVFVKEARAHNGYGADWADARHRLRHEHRTLARIHDADAGLCPEPVDYFARWEHEFLVTEFVEGQPLLQWASTNQVLTRLDTSAERRSAYHRQVEGVLASLRDALDRLHALGLRFGDLSHGNVLVTADGSVRLIDFETATELSEPPSQMGTLGYVPPEHLREAGVDSDEYAYSSLAMQLLFPLARPLQIDPTGRLALHRRDLDRNLPIPDRLWDQAARYYGAPAHHERSTAAHDAGPYRLPTAAELDDDPLPALHRLASGIAAGIVAMARPDSPDWLYPPGPAGYSTNTHCMAHGTAGVLLALRRWGTQVPASHLERFRRDALTAAADLPPGLQAGLAGIAWTLSEYGHLAEAEQLLRTADAHPLLAGSVLFGHGAAGVGMAHLRLRHAAGDPARLDAAARLADRLLADDLAPALSGAGTPGIEEGLSGMALFLHVLAQETGEDRYGRAALRLMHAELDKAEDHGADGLRFTDRDGWRIISYLSIGSAGVVGVLSRLAAETGDERCADALPRIVLPCRATTSVEPGLYTGVASWVYALAEYADFAGGPQDRETAVRVATSLAKYAVRFSGGLRVLGSFEHRYHCDLANGGAGTLLALARVLGGPHAGLFSLAPALQAATP